MYSRVRIYLLIQFYLLFNSFSITNALNVSSDRLLNINSLDANGYTKLNHENLKPQNSSSSSSVLIDSFIEEKSFPILPSHNKVTHNGSISILLDRNSWALHNHASVPPLLIKTSPLQKKSSIFNTNNSRKEKIEFPNEFSSLEPLIIEQLKLKEQNDENLLKEENMIFLTNFAKNVEFENSVNQEEDVLM